MKQGQYHKIQEQHAHILSYHQEDLEQLDDALLGRHLLPGDGPGLLVGGRTRPQPRPELA